MAKAHKSEVGAMLGALPNQQRQLLDALYEQIIVGGSLDLSELAARLGIPYATVYERMERALSELGRQAQRHAAVRDWLRAYALKDRVSGVPQSEFTRERSRLGLYYLLSKSGEDIIRNSAGPLVLHATGTAVPLSDCLASVDSVEGRTRVAEYLNSLPFPHYESAGRDGLLIRIEKDGSRTVGRFVNRQFQAVQC
jgi:hypothetical protein